MNFLKHSKWVILIYLSINAYCIRSQVDSIFVVNPLTSRVINYENALLNFQFNNLAPLQNNVFKPLYTDTIRTIIGYHLGNNRFQELDIEHWQILNTNAKLALNYQKDTWDGNFTNDGFEADQLRSNYNYENPSMRIDFLIERWTLKKQLNEGVTDVKEFEDTLQTRAFIDVRNNEAMSAQSHGNVNIEIVKKQKSVNFGISTSLNRFDYNYNDPSILIDSLFSLSIYKDSLETEDHFHEGNEEMTFLMESKSRNLRMDIGFHRHYYRNNVLSEQFGPLFRFKYLSNNRFLPQIILQSYWRSTLLLDMTLLKNIQFNKTKLSYQIDLDMGNSSNFYDRYCSNYYYWDSNLNDVQNAKLSLNYVLDSLGLAMSISSNTHRNYIYFDGTKYHNASFVQSDLLLQLSKSIHVGKHIFFLADYSYWNQLEGSLLRYPAHIGGLDIKYSFNLLKDKMKCQLSLENNVRSSFEQYGFNSVVYAFVPEAEGLNSLPSFYFADLAFSTTIADIDFEIALRHLNQGITSYTYYDFKNQPAKDRFLTFGVKVRFND